MATTSIINFPFPTSEQQKIRKGETESFFFKDLSDTEHMLAEEFLKEHNKQISTF